MLFLPFFSFLSTSHKNILLDYITSLTPANELIKIDGVNGIIIIASVSILFVTSYDNDHREIIKNIRLWIYESPFTSDLTNTIGRIVNFKSQEDLSDDLLKIIDSLIKHLHDLQGKIDSHTQEAYAFHNKNLFKKICRKINIFNKDLTHFSLFMFCMAAVIITCGSLDLLYMISMPLPKLVPIICFLIIGFFSLCSLSLTVIYILMALKQRQDHESLLTSIKLRSQEVRNGLKYIITSKKLEDDILTAELQALHEMTALRPDPC